MESSSKFYENNVDSELIKNNNNKIITNNEFTRLLVITVVSQVCSARGAPCARGTVRKGHGGGVTYFTKNGLYIKFFKYNLVY